MSEETFDLFAAGIVFALALHAFLRRHAVTNPTNDVKGRIADYAA